MFPGSRAWPVRKADDLTAICKLSRQCGILYLSQPYRSSRPVTEIVLLFIYEFNNTNKKAMKAECQRVIKIQEKKTNSNVEFRD
jgi:hypothetical protein